MIYRKRRDSKGRLLSGYHFHEGCRWWPTDPARYEEYTERPWGDRCNHCDRLTR